MLALRDGLGWLFFCSWLTALLQTSFFLPVSSPLNRTNVGGRSELQQPGWFGSARVWEEPSKAGTEQANSNVVAGMSLAWLGLSAEEESQQPPARSCSWPHCWLNRDIC